MIIEHALIVKSPYIERILDGSKIWEMRSRGCSIRGPIGLIQKGSGLIVGITTIVDCLGPLTPNDLKLNVDKHCIYNVSPETEKWNIAWVLKDSRPLREPISYDHPKGAVIWVKVNSL